MCLACLALNVLPQEGGLLDQDALWARMLFWTKVASDERAKKDADEKSAKAKRASGKRH